jgi:ATP-dependent Lhr-like helicase
VTSAADLLHPALQHHIVNTLGWRSLRQLQEEAIGPILNGEHALLLAPTAGGKTEAAALPVLSRMLDEDWRGLSVLYLCPLRALLNNLEPRLSHLAGLVGRSVALWHGDVSQPLRKQIVSNPPDILLTTPESLEAILISRLVDAHHLLRNVRVVVIDELHAFAGDDRGWHLLAVLERVRRIAGREPQRIGLSATVGNPDTLLEWLAGCTGEPRSVIEIPSDGADADLTIDAVGNLGNAARVISELHRGEKRLVFCDSRARVEELGAGLRALGVETYLSHSSLAVDERRRAEAAFAQGTNCVIVATSTLELGLDVGDLDRVIQIDAPFSVASFLQRLGRTGRRPGLARNTLFLTTDDESFLRACAIARLWQIGFVEPIEPPATPYHVLVQQLLALTLQEGRIGRRLWREWVGRVHPFAEMNETVERAILARLIRAGLLHEEEGLVSIGPEAERNLGWRHFTELTGIVSSDPEIVVRYGQTEVGRVHPLSFRRADNEYAPILLGGRSWRVTSIDERRRVAHVAPDPRPGKSRWRGDARALDGSLCRAIRSIVAGGMTPARLTRRGEAEMESLRDRFWWAEGGTTTVVTEGDDVRWWTFAGLKANAQLADALRNFTRSSHSRDNLSIQLAAGTRVEEVVEALRPLKEPEFALSHSFVPDGAPLPKFAEWLPSDLALTSLSARTTDRVSVSACLSEVIQGAAHSY